MMSPPLPLAYASRKVVAMHVIRAHDFLNRATAAFHQLHTVSLMESLSFSVAKPAIALPGCPLLLIGKRPGMARVSWCVIAVGRVINTHETLVKRVITITCIDQLKGRFGAIC